MIGSKALARLTKYGRFVISLLLLVCTVGCSSLTSERSAFNWFANSEPMLPTIVLPIWTDTVLHQTGKPAVRGFGARVYFYEREGADPIKVDGSITVYVFDGEDHTADSSKPLRKYVITADQLQGHHSVSDLGHSYSVWVPWDQVGGPSKTFSLITRFDGRNGGTAVSESASKLLPGAPTPDEEDLSTTASTLQQVSFTDSETTLMSSPEEAKTSNAYSLTLPRSFQRHLHGGRRLLPQKPREQLMPGVSDPTSSPMGTPSMVRDSVEQLAPPEVDYRPSKFPVQRELGSQRDSSLYQKTPLRAGWRSGLPPTPRSSATKQD